MKFLRPLLLGLLGSLSGCVLPVHVPYRQVQTDLPADARVVVALTAAEFDPAQRSIFLRESRRIVRELPTQPDLVGFSARFEALGTRAWTMTAWRDRAAVERFGRSASHRQGVTTAGPALRSVRVRIVELPAAELPLAWDRAMALLAAPEAARD